jgi:glycine/D-amino acid oxidase-like deaminating enzyme
VHFDSIVIGGGFYGARLALTLRAEGETVLLLEREPVLLGRASLVNQARVHNGYHYPRSVLTSIRSRLNYDRFRIDYGESVYDLFDHYYAIAHGSKTTAVQFAQFCKRVGAPASPAPDHVRKLFDPSRIEDVVLVQECAFNAVRLRERLSADLTAAEVDVRTGATAARVAREAFSSRVFFCRGGANETATSSRVFNCTYSSLNSILSNSSASQIPLKRELAEMALVVSPPELEGLGVTVMDGPYFSLMPYPSRQGLSTLSHVRYTPHCAWFDSPGSVPLDGSELLEGYATRFPHMVRDAARFLPCIAGAKYVDSLWEIKAIMPRSEQDDSRPILFRESKEIPGLFSVLGAKIDSAYDVESELTGQLTADPSFAEGKFTLSVAKGS